MSISRTVISAGLAASVIGLSVVATAPAAQAGDRFWGGVAAGAVGGIIGGAIINEARRPAYAYPVYEAPPPPPPPVYRTYYRPVYVPSCHYEWRHNEWGDAYRVQVCPR
ncbi:hypothetical protein [Rhizobium sp.]|uniref:hypothetical protein n=1 Tax=Rhizobium sp. TaxID=391 RepID=UPI000E929B9F|nr:hypothetical protein [Rhizobium sp.]